MEQAKGLVDECEGLGVPAESYVFDFWLLSRELAEHVESYGKGWVSRLKANRVVPHRGRKMSIRDLEAGLQLT
ncbi:MAG: hypothetical protein ABIG39_00985 [Candidatus Micrarchaeota archaeon]